MPTSFHKELEIVYNKRYCNQIFKWKQKTKTKGMKSIENAKHKEQQNQGVYISNV